MEMWIGKHRPLAAQRWTTMLVLFAAQLLAAGAATTLQISPFP